MTAGRADLVVVGAGVIGCMVALLYRRAHSGAEIIVVDRGAAAGGASGASLCAAIPAAPTATLRALVRRSDALFAAIPVLARHLRHYAALYCVSPQRVADFRGQLAVADFVPAAPAQWSAAEAVYGPLARDAGRVVLDGRRHAYTFDVTAFVHAALRAPEPIARLVEGRAVAAVRRDGDRWSVETGDGVLARARAVALCTGPWTAPPVTGPDRHWAPPPPSLRRIVSLRVALPGPAADAGSAGSVIWVDESVSLIPAAGGAACYVNFTRGDWPPAAAGVHRAAAGRPVAPAEFTDDDRAAGLAAIARLWPGRPASGVGGLAGHDSYTPDRHPRIDRPAPGVVSVTGTSGAGVRLAPALAEDAVRDLTAA
ncbi:NAD(P)/FAD-dependent oxidoreductase [Dactylosporangium sp. CA-139114]|uniref:NAD(P)/FAD-dependent oxidoreductase n=1 Tax=Dactylosporangium sp. CA-139114 TaxID=3239931 RepID=UPI003D957F43